MKRKKPLEKIQPLDYVEEEEDTCGLEMKFNHFLLERKYLNDEERKIRDTINSKKQERKKKINETLELIEKVFELYKKFVKELSTNNLDDLFRILDTLSLSSPLFFYDSRLGHICPNKRTLETISNSIDDSKNIVSIGSGNGFFEWVLELKLNNKKRKINTQFERMYHIELKSFHSPVPYFLDSKTKLEWDIDRKNFTSHPPNSLLKSCKTIILVMPTLGYNSLLEYLKIFNSVEMIIVLGDSTCQPDPQNDENIGDFKTIRFEEVYLQKDYFLRIFQR